MIIYVNSQFDGRFLSVSVVITTVSVFFFWFLLDYSGYDHVMIVRNQYRYECLFFSLFVNPYYMRLSIGLSRNGGGRILDDRRICRVGSSFR